ncbi:hypothetical protein SFRURICE_014243 [Spodoptera frugiperda]|nr:hypothetical protein SFRURICE_014243 [Spodoptera frugiperda]
MLLVVVAARLQTSDKKRGPRLRSPATPQSAVSPDPRLSDPLRDSGKRVAKKLRAQHLKIIIIQI